MLKHFRAVLAAGGARGLLSSLLALSAVGILPSAAVASNAALPTLGAAVVRSATARRIVMKPRPSYRRPVAALGASDVQLFAVTVPPGGGIDCLAFDPSDAFWFVPAANTVVRYTASGAATTFDVPRAVRSYPDGCIANVGNFMYLDAVGGIERIPLSRSGRRFFQLSDGPNIIGAGPNDSLWLITSGRDAIERFDRNLNLVRYPLSHLASVVQIGPDGLVYYGYALNPSRTAYSYGVIRLNLDGSETLYDGANLFNATLTRGGLYYIVLSRVHELRTTNAGLSLIHYRHDDAHTAARIYVQRNFQIDVGADPRRTPLVRSVPRP